MASRLLNSGDLKNYQPIGVDGVLVWQRAEAFIASIETAQMLKDENYSYYLAKPRFSADGEHVDWFIPFASQREDGEYEVVNWNAASLEEKKLAYEALDRVNQKFLHFGYNLETRALTSNDKLLAHFLTGKNSSGSVKASNPAIHFPDESCLFIVNCRPVITFWGFLNKDQSLRSEPFQFLSSKISGASVSVNKTASAATVSKTVSGTASGFASGAAEAGLASGAGAAAVTHRGFLWWLLQIIDWAVTVFSVTHRFFLWWLLPLLLLLLLPLLLYLLWWWFFARPLPLFDSFPDLLNGSLDPAVSVYDPEDNRKLDGLIADDPKLVLQDKDQLLGKTEVLPNGETAPVISDDEGAVLPDGDAPAVPDEDAPAVPDEDTPAVSDETASPQDASAPVPDLSDENNVKNEDVNASDNATDRNAMLPPLLDDISSNAASADKDMSNKDLMSGDISRFDGKWDVISNIVDRNTNRRLNLSYEFKDGKGTATIVQKNGVKCVGSVSGGLNGGSLNINGTSQAKCTDGTVYDLPNVVCKTGANGKSNCTSIYKSDDGSSSNFPMILKR